MHLHWLHTHTTFIGAKAAEIFSVNIELEIVNLYKISGWDRALISNSVNKTKKLVILDMGNKLFSVGSQVIADLCVSGDIFGLNAVPQQLTDKGKYSPSSPKLSKDYYLSLLDIVKCVSGILEVDSIVSEKVLIQAKSIAEELAHDVPNKSFCGPF